MYAALVCAGEGACEGVVSTRTRPGVVGRLTDRPLGPLVSSIHRPNTHRLELLVGHVVEVEESGGELDPLPAAQQGRLLRRREDDGLCARDMVRRGECVVGVCG
jgi:hypothetical protein